MKKYILLIPLILSGCTIHEIKEIEKDTLSLFQKKVEMDKGVYYGVLVSKKPIGKKFICYYDYYGTNVSGLSFIKDSCPKVVPIVRN